MTYSEKLKHPSWQKKRLEILSRDGFKCCECGSAEKTLHVHHKHYDWGVDPWDYLDGNFITLCHECHDKEEQSKWLFKSIYGRMLEHGVTYLQLTELIYPKFKELLIANEQKGQTNG